MLGKEEKEKGGVEDGLAPKLAIESTCRPQRRRHTPLFHDREAWSVRAPAWRLLSRVPVAVLLAAWAWGRTLSAAMGGLGDR